MNCRETREKMNDFLDAYLSDDHQTEVEAHVNQCRDCFNALQEEIAFRKILSESETPQPSATFAKNVLPNVVARHRSNKRKQVYAYVAAAAAACIVIWLTATTTGIMQVKPASAPDMTMTLHDIKDINLILASESQLDGARLVLHIPEKIQIVGYQGQRELAWTITLKKGKNFLTLPLQAVEAGKTVLEAKVEHNQRTKIHLFHLVVQDERKKDVRSYFAYHA